MPSDKRKPLTTDPKELTKLANKLVAKINSEREMTVMGQQRIVEPVGPDTERLTPSFEHIRDLKTQMESLPNFNELLQNDAEFRSAYTNLKSTINL